MPDALLRTARLRDTTDGLEDWGPFDPSDRVAGEGLQRGLSTHEDAETTVGLWECTAMRLRMGPYSVDEFMVLLAGSVTIEHAEGPSLTVNAGQCFVIPRGTACAWRNDGLVRKFYVIFKAANAPAPAAPEKLRAFTVDTALSLPACDGPDPALVLSGAPQWRDRELYADPTGRFRVGLWSTTPYARRSIAFPRHEMMHFLGGALTIADGDGAEQRFAAGDTSFTPLGAPMAWANAETVTKVYCSVFPPSA